MRNIGQARVSSDSVPTLLFATTSETLVSISWDAPLPLLAFGVLNCLGVLAPKVIDWHREMMYYGVS